MTKCAGPPLVVILLLSCSSGETTAAGAGGATEFCPAYADALCRVYVPCSCSPGGMAECVDAWRDRCLEYATDEAQDGRRFVVAAGQACLERVAAHVRDCRIVDATQYLPEPWYCGLFRGASPAGAECQVNEDCAQPATGRATCVANRCTLTNTLDVGEPCSVTDFEQSCLPGLWCNGTTGTCSEPGPLGAPCEFRAPNGDFSCAAPFFCSPMAGRCTAPAELGQACEPYFFHSTCEPGADCQDQQTVCEPSLVADFARCQVD